VTSDALVRLLSENDLDTGIFPSSIGLYSHFRKLERLGLLVFDGHGRDIDGMHDRDVPIYQLTEDARAILAARDAYIAALRTVFAPASSYVTPTVENSSHG
jgi:hypothetical protein